MASGLDALELVAPAGAGGMGRVFQARHLRTGMPLAVKIPDPEMAHSPSQRSAFRDEARTLARLHHPSILRVFDYGEADRALVGPDGSTIVAGTPFLIVEWLARGSLEGYRPADAAALFALLRDLLSALGHVHARGLIHRDLKPSNVLLAGAHPDGRVAPRLADFGITLTAGAEAGVTGRTGTAAYMAPEQALGARADLGPWTDLYALGACAWHWLTGAPPHGDSADSALARSRAVQDLGVFVPRLGCPDGTEAWLRRLLASNPAHRFPSSHSASAALDAIAPRPAGASARADSTPPLDLGLGLVALCEPPIVGRDAELRQIERALDRVRSSGLADALAVLGPNGIGRSAVALHAARRAHEGCGARIVRVDATTGIPGALGRALGLASHPLSARLRRAADRWPAATDDERALIAQVAGGEMARPEMVITALHCALKRWSAVDPVVVVGEGSDALDLARHLRARRTLDPMPVLLLLDGIEGDLPEDIEGIALASLPDVDAARLIRSVLPVAPELVAPLVERATGLPGMALDVLRLLASQGRLTPGDRGHRLVGGSLPAPSVDTWAARILAWAAERTSDRARTAALIALLGEEVSEEAVLGSAEIAGLSDARGALEDLFDAGLATRAEGSVRLAHPVLRQHLLAEAEATADRVLILAAAECCTDPGRAGSLLAAGGRPEIAVERLSQAIDIAIRRGDFRKAHGLLAHLRHAVTAAGLGPTDPWALRLALFEATTQLEQGARGDIEAELLRLSQCPVPDVASEAGISLAGLLHARGASREALEQVEAAGAVAREAELPETLARMDLRRGEVLSDLGRYEEADVAYARAASAYEALGWPAVAGEAWSFRSTVATRRGRSDEAEQHLDRAEAFYRAGHATWHALMVPNQRAEIRRLKGDLEGAAEGYRTAWERCEAVGSALRLFPLANLGLVLTLNGQALDARAAFEAAVDGFTRFGRHQFAGAMHVSILPCLLDLGDLDAAESHLDRAERLLSETGYVDQDIARSAEQALERLRGEALGPLERRQALRVRLEAVVATQRSHPRPGP